MAYDDPYDPTTQGLAGLDEESPLLLAQAQGAPAVAPAGVPAGVAPPPGAVPAPPGAPPPGPAQQAPAGLAAPGAQPPQLTPEQRQAQSMLNFFRDPKRLAMAATIAAQHNQPDVLKWLQMGHAAQKENTGEALGKLAAGDMEGAMQVFNMNGDTKVTNIKPAAEEGTYALTFEDGKTREVNPKRSLMALLTPPKMFEVWDKEEATRLRGEMATQRTEATIENARQARILGRERIEALEGKNEALRLLYESQRGLTDAKKEQVGVPKAEPDLSPNQREVALDKAVRQIYKPDETGRQPPPAVITGTRSLAAKLMDKSRAEGERLDPDTAVDMARSQVDDAVKAADKAVKEEIKRIRGLTIMGVGYSGKFKDETGYETEKEYREAQVKKALSGVVDSVVIPKAKAKAAVAAPATTGLPEGVPEGSKRLGVASDGSKRIVYQAPDGKKYAVAP